MKETVRSLWCETAQLSSFAPLHSDLRTDVLIVGGGLAGILCAHMLREAGVDYALVEAGKLCGGATRNTTAKITVQHGLIYHKLIRDFGYERAQMYLHANRQALDAYRELCAGMDCDMEEKDSYVYCRNDRAPLDCELSALQRLGVPARMADSIPLPVGAVGAVCIPNQAQFHPMKFVSAIAKDLHAYENTRVLELAPGSARTPEGNIRAKRIIIATHFPMLNKYGFYFIKLYQHRSYVLALENAPDVREMYVDEAEEGMSFRNHRGLLLLGGGDHRSGKKGGGWQELLDFVRLHEPQARVVCRWATQDCMTLDGVPYIGRYSCRTPDLYVLTGFNKWGMTGSMAGAMLLRDMILDRTPDWAEVFSPSRSVLHGQLFINAAEAVGNLLMMGCAMGACAAGLEDFNDYENQDGTYTYYFDQRLFVTMPEDWYQNTMVIADMTSATFYHRDSYERYAAEGIEGGGKLFTIGCSVNTDFENFEEMTYIGFDEEEMLNYFATKPTDYPAYAADADVRAEYDALWAEIDDVIAGIRLSSAA